MNVRHLVPSVSRRLLSMGSLILAASLHYASGQDLSKYKRIEPQFIAAAPAARVALRDPDRDGLCTCNPGWGAAWN